LAPNSPAVWQCGGGASKSSNGQPKFDGAPDLAAVRPNSTAVWQCGGGAPILEAVCPNSTVRSKSGGGPPTFNGGLEMQSSFWQLVMLEFHLAAPFQCFAM